MSTRQEYEQWRNEPYSVIERACYRAARDRRGRIRPNAKAAIDSLMTCIGTYGPAGWGLSIEAACRIAMRKINSANTYDDIWLRWLASTEPADRDHSTNDKGSCVAAGGVRRATS